MLTMHTHKSVNIALIFVVNILLPFYTFVSY